eukprot:TRINITY_DN3129_c1_g3_i1.p1 TRINITY_DN3129_c1_g3~~TRINITY_DN3129_c1_g3_i1.p1  ORF type:complete len:363 (+),score=143.98 TRINITY_DN3129_c1_g3_i1:87-1091(+)
MVFLVSVGTDLYGRKANAKLEFPSCPTMAELINAVESHYDVETRSQRPAGYPDIPFRAETMQVYDDVLLRWVDLYSPSQLADGCQAFCFQPESIWHSDAQDIIPEGKQAVTWTTPMGSPSRARAARDAGIPPALSEKLRSVFYDIDTGNKGYVLYTDLRAAFQRCDIEFTYSTVGELFTAADADRSGHITYDEWVRFAINFPQVVDALFFRLRDLYQDHSAFQRRAAHAAAAEEAQREAAARAAAEQEAAARARREAELRRLYEEQWASAERARQQAAYEEARRAGQDAMLREEYEQARREAEAARMQKELAEGRERAAWDKLHYSPSSPGHFR